MRYIQISIKANQEQQEILLSELSDLDAIGFEQKDMELLAYFDEDNFKSQEVNMLLKNYSTNHIIIQEQNWNALWESNFKPVIVDDFCAIRADFHQEIKNVQHEIIITPKMSFGTGHHATTYMMIDQMRHIDFKNKKVFDFGTGTGILSILAEKLGAASVTSIDNDEWSIKNAEENFQKNNVRSINLYQSSILPPDNFDIILANINRNVLGHYSCALIKTLSPGGCLLMSGFLEQDEQFIIEVFSTLKLDKIERKQNWISLLFTN